MLIVPFCCIILLHCVKGWLTPILLGDIKVNFIMLVS